MRFRDRQTRVTQVTVALFHAGRSWTGCRCGRDPRIQATRPSIGIRAAPALIRSRLRTALDLFLVPRKGIEPPHLAAAGPKPAASTNFATWALPYRPARRAHQRAPREEPARAGCTARHSNRDASPLSAAACSHGRERARQQACRCPMAAATTASGNPPPGGPAKRHHLRRQGARCPPQTALRCSPGSSSPA